VSQKEAGRRFSHDLWSCYADLLASWSQCNSKRAGILRKRTKRTTDITSLFWS